MIKVPFIYSFQSIAGVVISLLVASTLVSATQCMKALYFGGLPCLDDNTTTIKVAQCNPTNRNQNLPESAVKDKTAPSHSPTIHQGNSTSNKLQV